MNRITLGVFAVLAIVAGGRAAETREHDYFKPGEMSRPLVLPELYSVSKFGRGLYRIDGMQSYGRMNCIFLTFTAAAPGGLTVAQELVWKTEHLEIEGRKAVRLSAVFANPFPREKVSEGDVLTVRIDALSETVAAELRQVAENFLPMG